MCEPCLHDLRCLYSPGEMLFWIRWLNLSITKQRYKGTTWSPRLIPIKGVNFLVTSPLIEICIITVLMHFIMQDMNLLGKHDIFRIFIC